jgi:hypothetical protein
MIMENITEMTTGGGEATESSGGESIRPVAGYIAPT